MFVCVYLQLTNKRAINELFSNMTWAIGQTETLNEETILSHWQHPLTNIYVTLVLFVIMNVSVIHLTIIIMIIYIVPFKNFLLRVLSVNDI